MCDDLCVESDSGGHTDGGACAVLLPTLIRLKNEMMKKHGFRAAVRVGAAGGIGAPEAAASAFILGADFIMTGSINQCTVEAGASDVVKDMLQQINIQDTAYAPSGNLFEPGGRIQVLRKGVFFPARANLLLDTFKQYDGLEDIPPDKAQHLQVKILKKSFVEIYDEVKRRYRDRPEVIERAERQPKFKMALVFKWYFVKSTEAAIKGIDERRVDFQVPCGPALGAFNQWVKGSSLESWHNRHVDILAITLMEGAADFLNEKLGQFLSCAKR